MKTLKQSQMIFRDIKLLQNENLLIEDERKTESDQ